MLELKYKDIRFCANRLFYKKQDFPKEIPLFTS